MVAIAHLQHEGGRDGGGTNRWLEKKVRQLGSVL